MLLDINLWVLQSCKISCFYCFPKSYPVYTPITKKTQKTLLHSCESLQLYSYVHMQAKSPTQHGNNHFR